MKPTTVGPAFVGLTSLGFGGAPIGNLYEEVSDIAARETIEASWRGGVRYFDTAPHYGLGLSEQRLGAVLAAHSRDTFTISTKVGRLLVPNPTPTGSDLRDGWFAVPDACSREWDFSRDGVRRSLESSLIRLGLDAIDIAYVHDPEEHLDRAQAEAIPALLELRDQGLVRAVGVGMNVVEPLRRFVHESDIDVIMLAGRWTLMDRSAEGLLDEARTQGVAVVAAAPFNSGLLARHWPTDTDHFNYGPATSSVISYARRLATVCEEWGVRLPHAALKFPLLHPAVKCVVAGFRTPAEASAATGWMTQDIPDALWRALERVNPNL